jgi:4-hydroxy-tetrahydrodipicolinate synthase
MLGQVVILFVRRGLLFEIPRPGMVAPMKIVPPQRGRVWSATPTPFTREDRVDIASVRRMIAHHIDLGVAGIMLAGTCGEGPWLRDADREVLVRTAVEAAAGQLTVAVQVTDNSAVRVLDNIDRAASWGGEIAVVAAPPFFINATPERVTAHYREVAQKSALPVGLYDRGAASPYVVPEPLLAELLNEPSIIMVKDSAQQPSRMKAYLKARQARPELVLMSGSEFDCVDYMKGGYDGLLLGGGIFNARVAAKIIAACKAGDLSQANALQARMNDLMYRVYGGPKIECWMTGLKELLVQLGVFSTNRNLLGYPLTDHCRAQITAAVTGSDGLGFREDLLGPSRSFAPLRS